MKIEHVAIWVNDLERMRDFYKQYFGGEENSYITIRKSSLNLIL